MKSIRKPLVFILQIMVIIFAISCNNDEDPEPEEGTSAIELANDGTLGSILTDANGVTLYFFAKDADGTSACLDGCLDNWPIFFAESPSLATGLDAADFGSVTHTNGEKQTTYKGWPLYYYSPTGDGAIEAAGATAGEGVGGVWFVAKPDYTVMLVNAQLVGHDGKSYTSDYTEGSGTTSYFVDSYGQTLYSFVKDFNGVNNFTASDLSNNEVWPVYEMSAGALPSVLTAADFSTIDVFGKQQLTYKGWPLYYFGQDAARGENKGVSFPAPGVWPIVNSQTTAAPAKPTVKTIEHETLGEVITDGEGRILYFFTKDVAGMSACVDGCLDKWPIFYQADIILPENGDLEATDFTVITRGDGAMQTTYQGWPLYYYAPAGDGVIETAGEANGEGVGSVWYVAKEYDLMIADAQLVGHDGNNYLGDYTVGDGLTQFFTDGEGRTLYIFKNDALNDNNFTAEDFSNNSVWPIFHTDIDALPSGMTASDFGEIEVFGEKQLTYRGWPVYYFGQDEARGQTKGVSFPSPGVWPIINNSTSQAQ